MRALVQRISEAAVRVEGKVIGECGPGLLILVCAMQGDTQEAADKLSAKIAKLRIFPDATGRMNRSLLDTGGAALVVSQFTLAADTSRGNRPGFSSAADPTDGERLYEYLRKTYRNSAFPSKQGGSGRHEGKPRK